MHCISNQFVFFPDVSLRITLIGKPNRNFREMKIAPVFKTVTPGSFVY